jgi:ATP-dependent Lon protease
MVARMSESGERKKVTFPESLPLLPVRDLVVLPYMMAPLVVSRAQSVRAVEAALDSSSDKLILLAAQKDDREEPRPEDLHAVGTVGMILKVRRLSEGRAKILVQGLAPVRLSQVGQGEREHLAARYERLTDSAIPDDQAALREALSRAARESLERWTSAGKTVAPELAFAIGTADEPGRLADLIAASLPLKVDEGQALLDERAPLSRLRAVHAHLGRELELLELRSRIETRAREELSRGQREVFLREQLRAIRKELGDGDGRGVELDELRARLASRGLPPEVEREAQAQRRRLEQLSTESAEAGVLRAFLDWIVELPWAEKSGAAVDMERARTVLDADHHGLADVKDRLLEHLAVLKLRGDKARGGTLCLAGPPGVGKTSLGRSIARALDRRFVRVSLGGVRDESEIRGHRRTYVGALPGRILQAMKQAGTIDPVIMLDEIDKLGADLRGDPASALLEVLDPEQNGSFRDHYLSLPYDLSKVMFVATCNHAAAIPAALRDRLELIEIPGYSQQQKQAIAIHHLVPRQVEAAGLDASQLAFSAPALAGIIDRYTREAGLRELERQIGRVARRVARRVAERGPRPGGVTVSSGSLERRLGPAPYPDVQPGVPGALGEIGVSIGLAWTPYGGEVLQIETQAVPGKGGLVLTGQLGDVMRESAQAALSWARAHAARLGLAADFFSRREIHVHVPAGAVPKDGPSAGVTMAAALVSLLAARPAAAGVAMTGEITLRGHVLPIGGLRDKLLAASRSPALHTVIVPAGNMPEVGAMPRHLRQRLNIIGARTLDEVLAVAVPDALAPIATVTALGE